MKLARRKKCVRLYVDMKNEIIKQEPQYEYVLVESRLKTLLKSKAFYYSLVLPLFFAFMLNYINVKYAVIMFSVALGLSLMPLIATLYEIFFEHDD